MKRKRKKYLARKGRDQDQGPMIGRDLEVEEDQEVQNILKNVRDHVINLLKKEGLFVICCY